VFETLTGTSESGFQQLRRRGKLSEADVDAAMREVRSLCLKLTSTTRWLKTSWRGCAAVRSGLRFHAPSTRPAVIKIVHEELIATLENRGV